VKKQIGFKLFFFILLSITFSAQNQQFTYEYQFANDSTAKNQVESEILILNVFKEGSQFYSRASFVSDSIRQEEIKKCVKEVL
jgi:GLPGLI family protein